MSVSISISADLSLRVLRPGDAGTLYAVIDRNREHLRQWLPWVDSSRSPADTRKFLEASYNGFMRSEGFTYGIRYRNELAGVVGFHGFDRLHRVSSLGYWLSQEHCRKGLMRQCVAACTGFAFNEQNMNRLYIRCATGNLASKRIPQALGFTFEGIQREAEWLYDHFVDLEVYSMLAREWAGRRPA